MLDQREGMMSSVELDRGARTTARKGEREKERRSNGVKSVIIGFRVPFWLKAQLQEEAAAQGQALSDYVIQLIEVGYNEVLNNEERTVRQDGKGRTRNVKQIS